MNVGLDIIREEQALVIYHHLILEGFMTCGLELDENRPGKCSHKVEFLKVEV